MKRYTWDAVSRLCRECGLLDEQIIRIKENLFFSPVEESIGFRDIAWELEGMIVDQSYLASAYPFREGSDEYNAKVCLAGLLLRLIELERPRNLDEGSEDAIKYLSDNFVKENIDIFASPALAVYLLEAGSGLFRDNLLKEPKEKSDVFLWLEKILKNAELYSRLLFYYQQVVKPKPLQADIFFLRLFLLYRFLEPDSENNELYSIRSNTKDTVIADIVTDNLPSDQENAVGPSGTSLRKSIKKADYQEILNVLREYAAYLPERDPDNLLGTLSGRLSRNNAATLGGALESLIGQRNEQLNRKNYLRMLYIDAAVLLFLCKETGNPNDFRIVRSAPGEESAVFITKNHRRQILLRADVNRITAIFRAGEKIERNLNRYTASCIL